VQKDAAEYLQQLLQAQQLHSVQWDDCNFELKAISPFQCRYLLRLDQTTKLTTPVRFDRQTHSGHYRALLKVNDHWMYTDDS
ncbi:Pol, partial [Symbiodinium necroappetens]